MSTLLMMQKPNLTLVDKTLLIDSPVETVFGYLSNHQNYPHWFPGVLAIQSADGLPHGKVGKVYTETLRLPTGRTRVIKITVMESDPPYLFAMQADFLLFHPRTEIRLSRTSTNGTSLNWKFLSRAQSPLARIFMRTLVKFSMQRQSSAGLRQLKFILDQTKA